MSKQTKNANESSVDNAVLVSLKSVASRLDADPSSVRRWLRAAGIRALVMSDGPRPAIRFKSDDVDRWLDSREKVS